jgi:acetyltransferase-like isoleucine patch superfamily enzyme
MSGGQQQGRYNRRPVAGPAPPPMRVRDEIIARCRHNVESSAKRRIRTLLLTLLRAISGAELGEGFQWGKGISLRDVRAGRYSFIGTGFEAEGPVSVGDLTMLSRNVRIVGADHVHDDPGTPMRLGFAPTPRPPTIIEADCWVGHSAILLEGITIRRGTVVAAGSVVTKTTEPYSIIGGVPGKLIRKRFDAAAQRQHDLLLYGEAGESVGAHAADMRTNQARIA